MAMHRIVVTAISLTLILPTLLVSQEACTPGSAEVAGEYTSPPLLRNPADVRSALATEASRLAEVESQGGRAMVVFLIDTEGAVRDIRLQATAGNPVSDTIAMRTARHARFHPAYLDREPVCLWMAYPFVVPPTGETPAISASPGPADTSWWVSATGLLGGVRRAVAVEPRSGIPSQRARSRQGVIS